MYGMGCSFRGSGVCIWVGVLVNGNRVLVNGMGC